MKTDAPKAKAGGGGGAGKLVMKEESGSGGISWRVIRGKKGQYRSKDFDTFQLKLLFFG